MEDMAVNGQVLRGHVLATARRNRIYLFLTSEEPGNREHRGEMVVSKNRLSDQNLGGISRLWIQNADSSQLNLISVRIIRFKNTTYRSAQHR